MSEKNGWRLATALLCLLLCVMLMGTAAAKTVYPAPTEYFFVNDYAGVLSAEDIKTVYEAGVRLQTATKAQVVLVTVDDLQGQGLEDYGLGLAREWGIGDKELDNGILLLFTTDGPHTRLEIGNGLEGALPDSRAGRILDTYLVPWYDDEKAWSEKLTDTYKALVNVTYAEYGLTEEQYPLPEELPDEEDDIVFEMIVLLFVLIVFFFSFMKRGRNGGFFPIFFHGVSHNSGFSGGGGFHGGGFSGGGFSGGGGGFSGGGASR